MPIDAKEPRLSPDGTRVAFLAGSGRDGNGTGNGVRVLRIKGKLLSVLVIRAGRGVHGSLAWSLDSGKLAFAADDGVRLLWGGTGGNSVYRSAASVPLVRLPGLAMLG